MDNQQHAINAARALLQPLARLLLAHGIQLPQLVELLKGVLVDSAREALGADGKSGIISKVSVATGVHRKEVKRLLEEPATPAAKGRFVVSEVFARWISDPAYLDAGSPPKPRALPRTAPAGDISFDALARAITNDVHPRTVLEDMKRLELVREEGDHVVLVRDTFMVADRAQMLSILAANVHDHLAAATDNTLATTRSRFLEQALVSDEMSAESVAELHARFIEEWKLLQRRLLPEMTRLWERDRDEGRQADQRIRMGMFDYSAPMDDKK